MQDMLTPRERGSIRDIPVPANHRHPIPPRMDASRPPRSRRWWLWSALAVIIIGAVGGLLFSTVFEGADITLYPKTQSVTGPLNFTAQPNAPLGALGYQVITINASATTTAAASGTQQVSTKATGLITIYNAYSTANQELITNTRFAAPNGNIYRIHNAVTVPGGTKQADGTLTPGSVTTSVYADQPGASYNLSSPTQFTIPGFQGTARYTAFSARSPGAITGGFVGTQPAVSSSDLASAQTTLTQQLNIQLQSAASSTLPSGFIPLQGSLWITYDGVIQSTGSAANTATLSQHATGIEAIISATDLAAAVATQAAQGYQGEAVAFSDPSQVQVSLAGTAAAPTGPLSLTASGSLELVWQFDENAIKQALVGKDKSTFQQIIQGFEPAVAAAKANVRPFWRATFPTDPSKITITISQPSQ